MIATRDRIRTLLRTLQLLEQLPERPPIVVVDNASSDDTTAVVRRRHPDVAVITLGKNVGGAARNVGARAAHTPYVAFSDDDSWWDPGALAKAVAYLDRYPRVGLLAARVLVGREQRIDPTCVAMANSPLRSPRGAPGIPVLGFIACGAVARREAFLDVGGFHRMYAVGGEERLLAVDLLSRGWDVRYVEDVVAHHHPAPSPNRAARRRTEIRNDLWTAWLRRPVPSAVESTRRTLLRPASLRERLGGLLEAVRGLPWVLRERRVVTAAVDRDLALVEAGDAV